MNRGKQLLILLTAVIVLGGALLALQVPDPDTGALMPKTDQTDQTDWWLRYERTLSDFRSITVTLPSGSYVLISDLAFDAGGNIAGVFNTLGQPVLLKDNESFRLRSDCFQTVMVLAANLPVTAAYEGLDIRSCGLDSPKSVLELEYENEETVRISIGNKTPSGDGCYICLDSDDKVYVAPADLYDVMCRELKEQHYLPAASAKSFSDVCQVALVKDGVQWIAQQTENNNSTNLWALSSPVKREADTSGIRNMTEGLLALKADYYETTEVAADLLAQYGLDHPIRLVAVFADGEIRDIRIGADTGNGYVYATMDHSGDIWLIAREQLDFLETVTPEDLLDPFVALINYRYVQKLDIRDRHGSITLEPSDKGTEETEWTMNGIRMDHQVFSTLYSAAVGILWDKTALNESGGQEELLTLSYRMKDETNAEIRYTMYDEFYVLAETENGNFLVRKDRLDPLLEMLKIIRNGQ